MPSKEAVQVMAGWVAAIADNVKNPITSIGLLLDRAEYCLGEPSVVQCALGQIRSRLGELNEYISELASFADPPRLLPQDCSIAPLLHAAIAAAHLPPTALVTVDAPQGLLAHLDGCKVTLVLKSLLRNAIEAVDAAAVPCIHVEASAVEPRRLHLAVEDNGPGLAANILPYIWQPFFSTKEAGTGLGLALVRKYVEAHGGSAVIDRSARLGGCRVSLLLPLRPCEER